MAKGDLDEKTMPLLDHLIELRQRLLYSVIAILVLFFVCYYFAPDIYDFLVQPLADILEKTGGPRRLIFTALHEAFFTYIKVALFAALCLPLLATQSMAQKRSAKKAGGAPMIIRQPVCLWWDTLVEKERRALVGKYPALAESFAFHRKMIPQANMTSLVADKSLGDWWLGLTDGEHEKLMKEHPGLAAQVEKFRKLGR